MDDNSLIFSRVEALLQLQAPIDGVRALTIAGWTFTSVEGIPYNTVNPSLAELSNGPQEIRNAFVDDLVAKWLEAVAKYPAVVESTL